MVVVDAVSGFAAVFGAELVPWGGFYVFAAVFGPLAVGFVSQDTGTCFANVANGHEGANVQADTVVQVRVPADRLFFQRFPADENVVRGFAFADLFEQAFQLFGSGQFFFTAIDFADLTFLSFDPVVQVCVDQCFQQLVVEAVVVDQDRASVFDSVPDLPDDRAVVEQLAVLSEEFISQP